MPYRVYSVATSSLDVRVYPSQPPAVWMLGCIPLYRRQLGCEGVSLSTTSSVDVQGVTLSTASSVDMQGVSLFTPSSVDVQGVSLSTLSRVDV